MLIYYGALFAVWVACTFFLFPAADSLAGNKWIFALIHGAVKTAVWALPFVLLIKKYERDMLFTLKGMFVKWERRLLFLPVFLVIIAYYLIGAYISFGEISVHADFDPANIIGTVLVAGIVEELVFRGFFLNALMKMMSREKAAVVTALMFLAIHFPLWIMQGVFLNPLSALQACAGIALLSLLFSLMFVYSKNIVVPALAHMLWNFLAVFFFGR